MSARALLLASLLSVCTLRASAQAPSEDVTATPPTPATPATAPKIKSTLTPATLQVGELAKLVITVDAPSATEVSLPEQAFGGLELADRHVQTLPQGERTVTTYQLDLLALEPGKLELPALTLRFVGLNGELSSGSTEPHELTVRSLIANEPNAEPKPLSKPLSVMRDDYTIGWVALGLLAVALIALATLLISRWLKRRPKPAEPLPPPRPAWELAIERLHGLLAQKEELLSSERSEEFVDGVSDALREYLGRRYGFDGLERTTGELMGTLQRLQPHKLSLTGVSSLLDQCDLVKFARAKPDADQCQDLWNGAIGLIRATTPLTQPLAAAQGPLPTASFDAAEPVRESRPPRASVPPLSVHAPGVRAAPPVRPPAPWELFESEPAAELVVPPDTHAVDAAAQRAIDSSLARPRARFDELAAEDEAEDETEEEAIARSRSQLISRAELERLSRTPRPEPKPKPKPDAAPRAQELAPPDLDDDDELADEPTRIVSAPTFPPPKPRSSIPPPAPGASLASKPTTKSPRPPPARSSRPPENPKPRDDGEKP